MNMCLLIFIGLGNKNCTSNLSKNEGLGPKRAKISALRFSVDMARI